MFVDSIGHGQGGAAARPDVAKEAMQLAALGWRVHPLRPPGEKYRSKGKEKVSEGKPPKLNDWPTLATTDEGQIDEWWDSWPEANLGVVLGPSSGIIDIECDSPEAEKLLQELFASHNIITPTFKSSKGLHRLFQYTDQLPNNKAAHWTLMPKGVEKGGVDFKIGSGNLGTYSVFPPSLHGSGVRYQWLPGLSPSECEVANVPLHVIARIVSYFDEGGLFDGSAKKARPSQLWDAIRSGVPEGGGPLGGRDTSATALAGKLAFDIDVHDDAACAKALNELLVFAAGCQPPLDPSDVEAKFRRFRNQEKRKRQPENRFASVIGAASLADAGWRAEGIRTDPMTWIVYSNHFSGGVEMSNKEFMNGKLAEEAIAGATGVEFDNDFAVAWNGDRKTKRGIRQLVQADAVREGRIRDPDPEECPHVHIARRLWHHCFCPAMVLICETGAFDRFRGRVFTSGGASGFRLPGDHHQGRIYFSKMAILGSHFSKEKFSEKHFRDVLRLCCMGSDVVYDAGSKKSERFQFITDQGLSALEAFADRGERPAA